MDIADRLDELLDLPTQAREAWLGELSAQDPASAERLRGLLGRVAQAEAEGFLAQPAAFAGAAGGEHTAGQRIGPWRLLRPLGEGGMAEVWLAERAAGDYERQVALKLTHAGGAALRFGRERDVMAGLTHPGIARFYDAGVSGGQAWIAMEFVEGQPLLAACAALPLRERVRVLAELAQAVQHAHAQLVVHRDIKPGNVLIDATGRPRLLDFGIARLLDGHGAALTRQGASPLTLEFAAPEQLRGETVGVACDVYALGLLGVVMLTGQSPFAAWRGDAKALMAAILAGRVGAPSRLAADAATARALRGDLDAILLRAITPDLAHRYPSAQAFADDLTRHLRGEPVQARPARWGYVAGRWLRRHRLPVGIAGVAAAGLLLTTLWALQSSQAERVQAARARAEYDFFRRLIVHDESEMSDLGHADRRVKDVILQAAKALPDSLQEAPEARYQLMRDLAPMLDFAGDNAQAVALLETQVAQARQEAGVDRIEAAKPLIMLAQLRDERRGDLAGAYALVQRAEDAFAAQTHADPQWLGSARAMSGFYGWKSGRLSREAGIAKLEAAAELLRRHPETRSLANDALSLLTLLYTDASRHEDALAAAEEGVAFNLQYLGDNNWHTAVLMEDAARAASRLHQGPRAEGLQRRALAIYARVFPPGNALLARGRGFLAQLLMQGQGQAEALQLTAQALDIMDQPQNRENGLLRGGLQGDYLQAHLLAGRLQAARPLEGLCAAPWGEALPQTQRLQAQRCVQLALLQGRPAAAQTWLARLQ
jgi:serine/threonine-protein kinase